MTTLTPRMRQLLRQANRAAEAGKRHAAEKLYRELLDEDLSVVAGWLGLANVVRDDAEREQIYAHVLSLDPDNAEAKARLAGQPWPEPGAREAVSPKPDAAARPAAFVKDDAVVEIPDMHANDDHAFVPSISDADDEVSLRCNRCNKPITMNDSKQTSVGRRCNDCLREIESGLYSATVFDYLLAFIVALPLGYVAGLVASFLGFFVIFLGAGAGAVIGTAVLRITSRRRGRYMPMLVATLVVFGGFVSFFFPIFGISSFWSAIYAFIAGSSAYYRLR